MALKALPGRGTSHASGGHVLGKALNRTFHIDGEPMDILMGVAFEIMDSWVAAGDDPKKQAELRKDDFRIL